MQIQGRTMGPPTKGHFIGSPQTNFYSSAQLNSGPPTFVPNQYPRP